jgi:Phage tail tube protein, GTA-gp10
MNHNSRDGSVELDWAGGRHVFRLGIEELEKVQEACDAGPHWVMNRLTSKAWMMSDLRAPLLWGLVGGGMSVAEAQKLLKTYLISPFLQHVMTSYVVLSAALNGAPDEDKKPEADESPNVEAATDSPGEK